MCRCRKACGPNTKLGAGLLAGFGITVDAYQAAVGAGVASLIRPDRSLCGARFWTPYGREYARDYTDAFIAGFPVSQNLPMQCKKRCSVA